MVTKTPTIEPTAFTAGDTVTWEKTLDCYKASEGWVLTYAIRNQNNTINLTATADGDKHNVSLTAVTTAGYTAGTYWWQSYATKASERKTVDSGELVICENLAVSAAFDGRSHAAKVFEALKAVMESKATADQLSYSIAGRSITKLSPEELLKWLNFYKRQVRNEENAEKLRKGIKDNTGVVKVRFTKVK